MKQNMNTTDRLIRIIVALLAGLLIMSGTLSGLAAIIAGIVAVIFIVTGSIGVCPLYMLLSISTSKQAK